MLARILSLSITRLTKCMHWCGSSPREMLQWMEGIIPCLSQMLSPYSRGLFRRAISQCGVALSPWALQKNPMALTKKVGTSCVLVDFITPMFTMASMNLLCADRSEGGLLEER